MPSFFRLGAVAFGGVDEVDAAVEGVAQEVGGLGFGEAGFLADAAGAAGAGAHAGYS